MQNQSAPAPQVSEYASLCAQLGETKYNLALLAAKEQSLLVAIDQLRVKAEQEKAFQERVAAEKAKEGTPEGLAVE